MNKEEIQQLEPRVSDFTIKKDQYRRSRDGNSKLLNISCAKCNVRLMIYQKDGIGTLRRTYLDRILWPKLVTRNNNLICNNCKTVIGIHMIYEPEDREAFRLIKGNFKKQTLK